MEDKYQYALKAPSILYPQTTSCKITVHAMSWWCDLTWRVTWRGWCS